MSKSVLLIAHSSSREGRVSSLLEERGYALDWRCPAQGDTLPDVGADYAAVVVFGGVQSANDCETLLYMREETDWIGRWVERDRPFLGICLGAQMLARAMGARVAHHPEGMLEVGYYPIKPTAAGRELFPDEMHVYHWHREGFEVPAGAELLATGQTFPNQAFRRGRNVYGLQFHPEVTPALMRSWIGYASTDLYRPGAQSEETQIAGSLRHDPPLRDWTESFLDHWLGPAAVR